MRKMYSKNQIKSISNEVVEEQLLEDGEIDTAVKSLITGGTLENAKPIYCHPLELYSDYNFILTALVFNNSNTAIDTWAKLKEVIHNFGSETYNRLLVSGGIQVGGVVYIASEIIEDVAQSKFFVNAVNASDGSISTSTIEITNASMSVVDGLNKIN